MQLPKVARVVLNEFRENRPLLTSREARVGMSKTARVKTTPGVKIYQNLRDIIKKWPDWQ